MSRREEIRRGVIANQQVLKGGIMNVYVGDLTLEAPEIEQVITVSYEGTSQHRFDILMGFSIFDINYRR
jgi:hypothetical protein